MASPKNLQEAQKQLGQIEKRLKAIEMERFALLDEKEKLEAERNIAIRYESYFENEDRRNPKPQSLPLIDLSQRKRRPRNNGQPTIKEMIKEILSKGQASKDEIYNNITGRGIVVNKRSLAAIAGTMVAKGEIKLLNGKHSL